MCPLVQRNQSQEEVHDDCPGTINIDGLNIRPPAWISVLFSYSIPAMSRLHCNSPPATWLFYYLMQKYNQLRIISWTFVRVLGSVWLQQKNDWSACSKFSEQLASFWLSCLLNLLNLCSSHLKFLCFFKLCCCWLHLRIFSSLINFLDPFFA